MGENFHNTSAVNHKSRGKKTLLFSFGNITKEETIPYVTTVNKLIIEK